MMVGGGRMIMGGGFRLDDSITRQKVRPGTVRRILPYAKQYRWMLLLLMVFTALDAGIVVANPLLLGIVIDRGIIPRRLADIVEFSALIAALGMVDAFAMYFQAWSSARIGQGVVLDLRAKVFAHVQRQPLAFFTRVQTGSLVSRLNTDVVGAQQAVTSLLSQTLSTGLTLALALAALFTLSWEITVVALLVIPLFLIPARLVGRRLQRLTREQMQLDAELGSMMNERFNVAGAMLTKLYGRPDEESSLFAGRAGRVRDVAVTANVYISAIPFILTLFGAFITALTYGLGGSFVISGTLKIGTLVSMSLLIGRLYSPINQLSNVQVSFFTALVSFDRIFEVLDLRPLIAERPAATVLMPKGLTSGKNGGSAPAIEFDRVSFRYPVAKEVSLASLESIALPMPERSDSKAWVLEDVSFVARGGELTALVGPSGAGKTTITHLVPRLYDPGSGIVRIGGHDLRDLTLKSLYSAVGVVPQDAHLFHDTIRANLLYACPGATEQVLRQACEAARIWDLLSSLPDGLDTVAGDRGYRFSGGERQRLALARLLLKAPSVVVLDEATAHLDAESEVAVQQALKIALTGRTSLVIAHRLTTILEADQILVVDAGQIRERGTHGELLAAGGLYAELYRTQFTRRLANNHDNRWGAGILPSGDTVRP
ncbi:MAG: ABC transporter ATP-binding protein [Streptosporangiaceae bacterium]|jgi:ATP-binding cassette subfamily B protein